MIRNNGFIRGQTGAFAHKAFARRLIGSRTEGSRMSALNLFLFSECRMHACARRKEQSKIGNCEGIARVHNHCL